MIDKLIYREQKEHFLKQHSKVIWLTGLSGAGKSTIAFGLEKMLFDNGYFAEVLDGDIIRNGINKNLGFSIDDRLENIRRIAEVSKLFVRSGIICINSFISPTNEIRKLAKDIIGEEDFVEVFIDTPLAICEERDVKGLYKLAREGIIKEFTGISSPFENPTKPNFTVYTKDAKPDDSIQILYNFLTINYLKY